MKINMDERQLSMLKRCAAAEVERRAQDLQKELAGGGAFIARNTYRLNQAYEQLMFTIHMYLDLQDEAPEDDVQPLLNRLREGLAEVTD